MRRFRIALAALMAIASAIAMSAGTAYAVVDGRDASTSKYPWMVFLSRIGEPELSGQFCGGTLVAPTKVVTAAHCVDDVTPDQFQVVGGRTDLRTADGTVRGVVSVHNAPRVPPPVPDPGDPPFTPGGDLAVLTLDGPMPYPTLPIAGPRDGWLYAPGRPATILGWGIYEEEGLLGPSPVLQQGRVPMLDYDSCNQAAIAHPVPQLSHQLDPRFSVCGGVPSGGPAACGGDSGGPLVIDGRLAGVSGQILSRNGLVCRTAYSGYTRTDVYADFIRAEIRGS